eukprot:CAMPEP_0197647902 /NCGR_PEP_ID=MMETSP1338-20131121/26839_1 /TAXON_ID=43686 ORGANISM="Pelagodinium beii, Strain RCC1491" /NCGR_SAMPLE_ID=MMETSP1338 /ASSEMBLY_ACC=CAM_ASM_000754 /LENGTH=104 /DNA_ID=CAMNT_0043221795 /DNA_START=54 /DNA_END=363 /DNA_ORIENTATION=-
MSKAGSGADLRKFMEKRLDLKLTANRHVVGVLRGYDQFMNIVLDNTVEIVSPTEKNEIGMVVIRGEQHHDVGVPGSREMIATDANAEVARVGAEQAIHPFLESR